jgi:Excalibur calcium-binding domain
LSSSCSYVLAVSNVATAKAPPLYKNCTNLNKKYKHGIGRTKARDRTSGSPVTIFLRSDRLYRIAMSYNRGLDRDHDGIACEKA